MPTYEYKCDDCGHEWEQEQGIKDPLADQCPACSSNDAAPTWGSPRRQIPQRTGFVLSGSGWARDGYKG